MVFSFWTLNEVMVPYAKQCITYNAALMHIYDVKRIEIEVFISQPCVSKLAMLYVVALIVLF